MNVERQQRALDAHHDAPGDRPVMRARFEHNGSPRYMLYTMKRLGLDHEHGFHLDVQLVSDELEGGMETVEARLQDGEADLIDIDYISTARERANGADIVAFHPYGRTVGGLVAPEDTDIDGLADLSGHRIGVVRRLDDVDDGYSYPDVGDTLRVTLTPHDSMGEGGSMEDGGSMGDGSMG